MVIRFQGGHRAQLDRILMACNRLIRGTGAWRNHEAFLRNVACIGQVVSGDDLHVAFVPMLKEEVLTAVSFIPYDLLIY